MFDVCSMYPIAPSTILDPFATLAFFWAVLERFLAAKLVAKTMLSSSEELIAGTS